MPICRSVIAAIALLLAACAHAPRQQATTPDCAPRQAWTLVRGGEPLAAACQSADYRQAARLARELGGLKAQRAQLEAALAELASDSPAAGQTRRRIRQLEVDIEAIRGVATTRGLVDSNRSIDAAPGSR